MTNGKLKMRWVTWFPSPYFVDRFAALAERPDVDFEALFMAASSTAQAWELDEAAWRFRYRVLDPRPTHVGYYRPNVALGAVRPLLQGGRDTVTVLNYADASAVVAGTIGRFVGRSFHLFVANTELDSRPRDAVREAVKRYMFRSAAGILATGPLQERYARRYVGEERRVHLIGNPVDTGFLRSEVSRLSSDRQRLRRERGWDSSFVVTYVGRLAPEKSIEILIRAAGLVRDAGVSVVLAIAGSGPMEVTLRDTATREGVRADFLGFLMGEQLSELYAAGDAFVLPSESEPWGLVVNEAMEFGLPVVVSDRVGCRHLLTNGENGFIVRHGDATHLAGVLLKIACDEERSATVGAKGRARIESETIDHWVDAVVTALRSPRESATCSEATNTPLRRTT